MAERWTQICENCDHSRRMGADITCWKDPPEPLYLYTDQMTNQRIVVPAIRPTWPWYRCHEWQQMQPDHPDKRSAEEHHPERAPVEPMPTAWAPSTERAQ